MAKIKKRTSFAIFGLFFFSIIFGTALGLALAVTVNTINTENFTEFSLALPTKLLDINGELITEFASDEKRETISLTQLPQHMIDALISREDRIFYKHNGFSLKAIVRAAAGVITGRSLGGGSTLTQQIAGTLYCDRTEKSLSRKLEELWWAIQMERRYSKDEILELYLNKVFFGAGTYGVNAASKYYFGHDATQISPAEAAILVVQLSSPTDYNPFNYPSVAMSRQKGVLDEMVNAGYITRTDADASFEDFWANFDFTRINSSAYYMRDDKAPWFSEYVRRELNSMLYGSADIYTSGYTVHTTMNLKHQQAAQDIMDYYIDYANESYQKSIKTRKNSSASTYIPMTELLSLVFNLPQLKTSEQQIESRAMTTYSEEISPVLDVMSLMFGLEDLKVGIVNKTNAEKTQESSRTTIEGTLISLENSTGYITALVGGSEFGQSNQLIRATQAKIQPGSSFKPLYYSAAIDSGKFTPATILSDTPTVFVSNGKPYIPQNFKGLWEGDVQVWYALSTSMNVVSVKILNEIGFDAAIDRAQALLGIPDEELDSRGFARVLPLGLGVCSVRPIEMARAFAIFGNEGKEVEPIAIRTVEDRNGNIILNPERDLRIKQQQKGSDIQVISPQTAYIMTNMLENTVKTGTLNRGSGWGARFKYTDKNGKTYTMPAAGKTGTTQNWADAWAVGYTPYITSAVWFGFDIPGQSLGTELTGSTLSGVAWGEFMRIANEDYPYKQFPVPQTGLVKAEVCSVSGQILTEACGSHRTTQYFLDGTQPTTTCQHHINRENLKTISLERLNQERLVSGSRYAQQLDTSPLVLDLSFLQEPDEYMLEDSSIQENTNEDQLYMVDTEKNVTENTNATDIPVYNYLFE
ncbi:MAG: PBP1A family penicillin-binding protein [Spirochaetaceae bacterium]|nr:PBP1A family penicillin-binding protein [Spirochaetaceae bacterium]